MRIDPVVGYPVPLADYRPPEKPLVVPVDPAYQANADGDTYKRQQRHFTPQQTDWMVKATQEAMHRQAKKALEKLVDHS